jgi:pimeloyl-ACP methyl ester carboxylesterase
VDLRGHGDTPVASWTWELVVDDVTAAVEGLGLDRPAVVGHSLGGRVAALWAASHRSCPLAVNARTYQLRQTTICGLGGMP